MHVHRGITEHFVTEICSAVVPVGKGSYEDLGG